MTRSHKAGQPIHWICRDCALSLGGRMGENTIHTVHQGECNACGKVKTIQSPTDWHLERDGKPFSRDLHWAEWD